MGVKVRGKRKKPSLKKKINDALADPTNIRIIKFCILGFVVVIAAIILMSMAALPQFWNHQV